MRVAMRAEVLDEWGGAGVVISLSIGGGPCTAYLSPPFGIYGSWGVQFTAGGLIPAFPESPGASVSFCDDIGYITTGTHVPAIAGMLPGSDAD